jgi:hypothetical protein
MNLRADAYHSNPEAASFVTPSIGKLESAATELEHGKVDPDALQALTRLRDKGTALLGQGKINPDEAQALIAGAEEVIICLQSLEP